MNAAVTDHANPIELHQFSRRFVPSCFKGFGGRSRKQSYRGIAAATFRLFYVRMSIPAALFWFMSASAPCLLVLHLDWCSM